MKEILATLTQRGQVTVPAEVRRLLGLKPRGKIAFTIEDQQVRLVPARFTLESAYGSVTPRKRPENFKKLIHEAMDEHADEVVREMQGELLTVVTREGQITIPAEIRRQLRLHEGDKVAVSFSDQDERATLRPVRSVAELTFGAVTPSKRPEDFKELRRLVEEGMADEVLAETPPANEDEA